MLALLARAAQLQIVEGERWAKEAERTRTVRQVSPARRGALYDRNLVPLAITQEFYHVGIAPNELDDRGAASRTIVRNLRVPAADLDREFRSGKRWIYLHGPFNATQVQPLRGIEGSISRAPSSASTPIARWPAPSSAACCRIAPSARRVSSSRWTRSSPASRARRCCSRTARGRRYDSPSRLVRDPVPGNDVVLTIDAELQEIAERGSTTRWRR